MQASYEIDCSTFKQKTCKESQNWHKIWKFGETGSIIFKKWKHQFTLSISYMTKYLLVLTKEGSPNDKFKKLYRTFQFLHFHPKKYFT